MAVDCLFGNFYDPQRLVLMAGPAQYSYRNSLFSMDGAAGTFIIGIVFFKDPATLIRMLSVLLIMVGIVGLKLAN